MEEVGKDQPCDVWLLSAGNNQGSKVHHNKPQREGEKTQTEFHRHGWIEVACRQPYPETCEQGRENDDKHRTERLKRSRRKFITKHHPVGIIAREKIERRPMLFIACPEKRSTNKQREDDQHALSLLWCQSTSHQYVQKIQQRYGYDHSSDRFCNAPRSAKVD